jgi:large subunit ribosomal protein L17e
MIDLTDLIIILLLAAQAKGSYLRIHYKHCREIARAIKGRSISKAKSYLENVLMFKEGIPFTKYTGGIGRKAVAKQYKVPGDKVAFPQKATKSFLDILTNVQANAEVYYFYYSLPFFLSYYFVNYKTFSQKD